MCCENLLEHPAEQQHHIHVLSPILYLALGDVFVFPFTPHTRTHQRHYDVKWNVKGAAVLRGERHGKERTVKR